LVLDNSQIDAIIHTSEANKLARMEQHAMTLRFINIVKVMVDTRSSKDQRKRVDATICSYSDNDGVEYRKTFESVRGVTPTIPNTGTHDELTAVKYQWGK
jgi:hypothetical protein